MIISLKKLSIVILLGAFFAATSLCCCLHNVVDTLAQKPSCHQSAKASDTPDQSTSCDCDQSVAVIEKGNNINSFVADGLALAFVQETFGVPVTYSVERAFENRSPPDRTNSLPLYIKYSILRI